MSLYWFTLHILFLGVLDRRFEASAFWQWSFFGEISPTEHWIRPKWLQLTLNIRVEDVKEKHKQLADQTTPWSFIIYFTLNGPIMNIMLHSRILRTFTDDCNVNLGNESSEKEGGFYHWLLLHQTSSNQRSHRLLVSRKNTSLRWHSVKQSSKNKNTWGATCKVACPR